MATFADLPTEVLNLISENLTPKEAHLLFTVAKTLGSKFAAIPLFPALKARILLRSIPEELRSKLIKERRDLLQSTSVALLNKMSQTLPAAKEIIFKDVVHEWLLLASPRRNVYRREEAKEPLPKIAQLETPPLIPFAIALRQLWDIQEADNRWKHYDNIVEANVVVEAFVKMYRDEIEYYNAPGPNGIPRRRMSPVKFDEAFNNFKQAEAIYAALLGMEAHSLAAIEAIAPTKVAVRMERLIDRILSDKCFTMLDSQCFAMGHVLGALKYVPKEDQQLVPESDRQTDNQVNSRLMLFRSCSEHVRSHPAINIINSNAFLNFCVGLNALDPKETRQEEGVSTEFSKLQQTLRTLTNLNVRVNLEQRLENWRESVEANLTRCRLERLKFGKYNVRNPVIDRQVVDKIVEEESKKAHAHFEKEFEDFKLPVRGQPAALVLDYERTRLSFPPKQRLGTSRSFRG